MKYEGKCEMSEVVLQMNRVTKNFGGVHALTDVDLTLYKGEVLCLVGENGAGKSTLMNVLTGVIQPTSGEIILHGEPVIIKNPSDAFARGISIVHQELVQMGKLTVAENIFAGRLPTKHGLVDYDQLYKDAEELMDRINIHFDPKAKVRQFSIAQCQLIEILKALSYDSSVIVFDEPTAALTIDECQTLYGIIKDLQKKGVSIIFISHRMADIYAVGERVAVLRDGHNSGTGIVSELTEKDIISMMVGRQIEDQFGEKHNVPGEVVLKVRDLKNNRVHGVNFDVRAGEVLGFGGLIGAGRTEILQAIFGIDPYEGEVELEGKKIHCKSPEEAIKHGISLMSENRKDYGLILKHAILKNISLGILDQTSRHGLADAKTERATAQEFMDKLQIKAKNGDTKAMALSGGNQQKVVIARCLASKPKVLFLDEPTRGVDVGAKAEIYRIIDDLACQGVAIVMVSSELPELIAISDRIIVMREGDQVGEMSAKEATEENIMALCV